MSAPQISLPRLTEGAPNARQVYGGLRDRRARGRSDRRTARRCIQGPKALMPALRKAIEAASDQPGSLGERSRPSGVAVFRRTNPVGDGIADDHDRARASGAAATSRSVRKNRLLSVSPSGNSRQRGRVAGRDEDRLDRGATSGRGLPRRPSTGSRRAASSAATEKADRNAQHVGPLAIVAARCPTKVSGRSVPGRVLGPARRAGPRAPGRSSPAPCRRGWNGGCDLDPPIPRPYDRANRSAPASAGPAESGAAPQAPIQRGSAADGAGDATASAASSNPGATPFNIEAFMSGSLAWSGFRGAYLVGENSVARM